MTMLLAEAEEEAGHNVTSMDTTCTRLKMIKGIDWEIMSKNPNGFQREIKIKGQMLEEVKSFTCLGSVSCNE